MEDLDMAVDILPEHMNLINSPQPIASEDLIHLPLNDIVAFLDQDSTYEQNLLYHDQSPYIGYHNKLQQLAFDASKAVQTQIHLYNEDFHDSMSLRRFFCHQIEHKTWYHINCQEGNHQSDQFSIVNSLVQEFYNLVVNFLNDDNNVPLLSASDRDNLVQWRDIKCKNVYMYQPFKFVEVMQKMLKKEESIIMFAESEPHRHHPEEYQVQSATHSPHPQPNYVPLSNPVSPQSVQLTNTVDSTWINLSSTLNDVSDARGRMEKVVNLHQHLQTRVFNGQVPMVNSSHLNNMEDEKNRAFLYRVMQEIQSCREDKQKILQQHSTVIFGNLRALTDSVLDLLKQYRTNMAYKMIGREVVGGPEIDRLQDICRPLGQGVNDAMDQINRLSNLRFSNGVDDEDSLTQEVISMYKELFKRLVANCLVIDKHPFQVVMKDKKFIVELRHLMGTVLPQTQFETTVALIDARTYSSLLQNHQTEVRKVGQVKIRNSAKDGKTRSTTNSDTGQVIVKFNNVSISIPARGGDRTKSETVAEEKLTLFFRSEIPITFCTGESTIIETQTFSLPLVVTTHGKQEADANATIFWDNAFHMPNRLGFEVFDPVPWENLLDYLDCFWRRHVESEPGYEVNTKGKGLDDSARQFLTEKFFGLEGRQRQRPVKFDVTWKQVSRNNVQGQDYSFWTWFYKVVELVGSPYVKKYWYARLIEGFISRQASEFKLFQCHVGTFMFRFSESQLGKLVITAVKKSKEGDKVVISCDPDSIATFKQKRSLPGNMKDLVGLQILYPNITKDDAFREFYEPDSRTSKDGLSPYVTKDVIVILKER